MQSVHPTVAEFSKLYQRQRGFHVEMISDLRDESLSEESRLISEINARVKKGMPHLTPEIVSGVSKLLGVSARSEFAVVRVICSTIEHFVSKKLDLKHVMRDMHEAVRSLREIESRKVKQDILRKPEAIILCQECEKRSSVLKCEQCLDHFCQECFDMLHATGNRKLHFTQEVEQLVCVACDIEVADCQCIQCGSFFCNACYSSVHSSRVELHKHRRRVISGLVCQECEHAHAGVICEDCVDLFCSACFLKLHKTGNKRFHTHLTVDANSQVFKDGLLVPQSEANAIIDKSRVSVFLDKCIEFSDDQGRKMWFDFISEETLYTSPY